MNENPKDLPILPTRTGTATGSANERQMDARVVDNQSWNTVLRLNPDGSSTRLKTRGGALEFITDPAPEVDEEYLYLESGAQTALDDSGNASVWNLLDIVPPNNFVGWIYANSASGAHAMGTLASGNASKAMIEPARKPVAKGIPASLFSGSMRLFIQAIYGAKKREELSIVEEAPYSYGVILTVGDYSMGAYNDHIRSVYKNDANMADASNRVLYYTDVDNDNTTIPLGFSANESCGLFRSGRKYWVITMTRSGTAYTIKAYPLKFSGPTGYMRSRVAALRAPAEQTDASREAARKCMAYALAYGKIDTANVVNLGTFSGPEGYPLAYGWKWNIDGTEARIIMHKTTISAGGSYWTANSGVLTIAYTDSPYIMDEADKFSVSLTSETLGYWKDHPSSKIYRPLSETVDPEADNPYRLHQTTVAVTGFPAAIGECTDRPIYGFYVGESWVPLLYSNFTSGEYGSFVYYSMQSMHGAINLGAGSDLTEHPLVSGIISLGYIDPGLGYTINIAHVTSGASQRINYKMVPKEGINTAFKLGEQEVITVVPNAPSKRVDMVASFVSGGGSPTDEYYFTDSYPVPSPFAAASAAFMAACYEEKVSTGGIDSPLTDYWVVNRTVKGSLTGETAYATRPAGVGDPIALVIPHGDSEAVFMATGDNKGAWTTDRAGDTDGSDALGLINLVGIRQYTDGGFPPVVTEVEDELLAPIATPVYAHIQLFNPTVVDVSVAQTGEDTVNTFINGKVPPAETPDEVVYADFWEPTPMFYEAGMYALSGTGTKFITSEGLFSDNIAYEDRFCGWV